MIFARARDRYRARDARIRRERSSDCYILPGDDRIAIRAALGISLQSDSKYEIRLIGGIHRNGSRIASRLVIAKAVMVSATLLDILPPLKIKNAVIISCRIGSCDFHPRGEFLGRYSRPSFRSNRGF